MLKPNHNGQWAIRIENVAIVRRLASVHCTSRQRGIVLFITLIVLVAMTLAGIAMVRSVSTTNVIAGNLAFQQGATHAGDGGIESAVTWLEQNNNTALYNDNSGLGYIAAGLPASQSPAAGQSWDNFWNAQLSPQARTLMQDAAGNTVSYVIQRMCLATGEPNTAIPPNPCSSSPAASICTTCSQGDSGGEFSPLEVYYRITARIAGPRNTVSYVQAIVALPKK